MTLLTQFEDFIDDKKAAEMFISGQAGTGKTTLLFDLVDSCSASNINYLVCAYTHKACGILLDKLPHGANISTLHKFLKKRPTVNENALDVKHIQNSQQQGSPDDMAILFVDEYSMLGERDYGDIGVLQYDDDGKLLLKVIYIGDPNQLPPIGDQQAIYPGGDHNVKLTKIYRQDSGSELLFTLTALVKMIEGATPEPLLANQNFIRGVDLVDTYLKHDKLDSVMLAFTNARVEALNRAIAGKDKPEGMDTVFSPTTKRKYTFGKRYLPQEIDHIELPFGDEQLTFGSKFRTLEHLIKMGIARFAVLNDDTMVAYVFGHYTYKTTLESLGEAAVLANKAIEQEYNMPAKIWAATHKSSKLAKERGIAWRDYFTFKTCVICLDFPYAMTIHKSQGSTYSTVFLDIQDVGLCADKNYTLYLRLLYVAISRAASKVYTN